MKLIVGLGNPGKLYADTRHNIGFLVIKRLSHIYKAPLKRTLFASSLIGKARIGEETVLLAQPLSFMNLSGSAVKGLFKKYKITRENFLAVLDDLDLEFGRLKIRPSGASGGHRGLQSIIEGLGSPEFARLRVGIGRPAKGKEACEHVLEPFLKKEKEQLEEMVEKAASCCELWAASGVTQSMNTFNRSEKNE